MCPGHVNVMAFIQIDIFKMFIQYAFIRCLKKLSFIVLSINFTPQTCMQEILDYFSKNQIACASASSSAEWPESSIYHY